MHLLDDRLEQNYRKGQERTVKLEKSLLDFASNDTLGLARSETMKQKILLEWQKEKQFLGSTGSPLVTGYSLQMQTVENIVASYHHQQTATIFGCGYKANIGLLSCIAQKNDAIFFDLQVHASMHDGIRLSAGKKIPFRHNDLQHLENQLKKYRINGNCWICVESIYSTDGSQAPLESLVILAQKYNAYLLVDEAHAGGIEGPYGKGLVVEKKLSAHVFAQIFTFGKSLGIYGAAIVGCKKLKEIITNFARSYIYSTALPFYALTAIQVAYSFLPFLEKERAVVKQHIRQFNQIVANASATHIQANKIPGVLQAKRMAEELRIKGFHVKALVSPTVPRGKEIVRICLHAFNTTEEVTSLLYHLQTLRIIR